MSNSLVRGASTAAVLTLALAGTASATPTFVHSDGMIDVSSDGRYVLSANGELRDRSGAGVGQLPMGIRTPVDLADRAPIALESDFNTGTLWVHDKDHGAVVVNIGPNGTSVPTTGTGRLVRNGTAVIFATTERPTRIIERDLTTGTSTVRLSGATLLDASEDGQVITWQRAIGTIARTSGTPIPGDPTSGHTAVAVGYQVAGSAPRVVDVTHYKQVRTGNPEPVCPEMVGADETIPTSLDISQDGSSARYSLVLGTTRSLWWYPFRADAWKRLTDGGPVQIASDDTQTTVAHVTTDPVSGAFTVITDNHGSYPNYNQAALIGDDGSSSPLTVAPAGSTDTAALYLKAVPFNRGGGVAYSALTRAGVSSGTWVDEPAAAGASTTPWTTLPRSSDPVDGPSTTPDATFITCPPTVVDGTIADYAPLALKTTGSSAGTITFTPAPAGKTTATSLTATVSWFGIKLWSRSATTAGTITLPAIFPGLAGFKATETVKLTNGTVLTSSTALRRTR